MKRGLMLITAIILLTFVPAILAKDYTLTIKGEPSSNFFVNIKDGDAETIEDLSLNADSSGVATDSLTTNEDRLTFWVIMKKDSKVLKSKTFTMIPITSNVLLEINDYIPPTTNPKNTTNTNTTTKTSSNSTANSTLNSTVTTTPANETTTNTQAVNVNAQVENLNESATNSGGIEENKETLEKNQETDPTNNPPVTGAVVSKEKEGFFASNGVYYIIGGVVIVFLVFLIARRELKLKRALNSEGKTYLDFKIGRGKDKHTTSQDVRDKIKSIKEEKGTERDVNDRLLDAEIRLKEAQLELTRLKHEEKKKQIEEIRERIEKDKENLKKLEKE